MNIIVTPTGDSQSFDLPPLADWTLEQLGQAIQAEDAAANQAASTLIFHAIRAGEALEEAFGRVGPGKWTEWVESLGLRRESANRYRRLARHQSAVLESGATTVAQAHEAVVGLPNLAASGAWNSKPDLQGEARQMHSEQIPAPEIARALGVAVTSVRRWIDPGCAARHREAVTARKKRIAAERRTLRKAEELAARQADAKAAGGDLASAYALIRKTLSAIDRAADQCTSREDARDLRATLQSLYAVEDEVARILRTRREEGA